MTRSNDTDVLIIGSGIMGAAVAQQVATVRPGIRILMVDGGPTIGSTAGQHLHDLADESVRRKYIEQVSPGIQSLYLGATVSPPLDGTARDAPPGMYHLSTFGERSTDLPAAAFAWNTGGMGVHWTGATPSPWGDEVFAFDGDEVWQADLAAAQRLLRVHDYPVTSVGCELLKLLDHTVGSSSASGRHPQTMPMAVEPRGAGRSPRTGPSRIFPRMTEPAGDDFELRSGTLVKAVLHSGGRATGALVETVATGERSEIRADVTVVAADTFRTPQLLFASGIRPAALGCYLNEHAFLSGQVIADLERVGMSLDDIAEPGEDEWVVGSYWLPHSGPAQPFHGQIMDRLFVDATGKRLAYSVGISIYVPTEVRAANRLVFSETDVDAAGMPQIAVEFGYTANDLASIEYGRQTQRLLAEAVGDFDAATGSALLPPGSSLHFTGTTRSGPLDDGTTVCDPNGLVWGFSNLFLAGGSVVPTAVVGNSTLTGVVTAVRAARELLRYLDEFETEPR